MVKILNLLFGWDFIVFQFAQSCVVRRVKVYPNGDRYVKVYGEIYFLERDGTLESFDSCSRKYRPLTWNIGE